MVAMAVCSERESGYFKTTSQQFPYSNLTHYYQQLMSIRYALGGEAMPVESVDGIVAHRQGYRPAGLCCWLGMGITKDLVLCYNWQDSEKIATMTIITPLMGGNLNILILCFWWLLHLNRLALTSSLTSSRGSWVPAATCSKVRTHT